MTRDPRRAYHIVDAFEAELCDYTGAPYAVAVNSCTNALLLALTWERMRGVTGPIRMPKRTYIGVLQSVLNAGFDVVWRPELDPWQVPGFYVLGPSNVWDYARRLDRNLRLFRISREEHQRCHVCLSFHAAKQLPLGRGGAILTDDPAAVEWFRAARMDGRPPGAPIEATVFPGFHCPMPPDVAARGLDILSRWSDTRYRPPTMPPTDYPDLSLLDFSNSHQRASSHPAPRSPAVASRIAPTEWR